MSEVNCCEMGKTGKDCQKPCKYYDDGYCNHPDAEKVECMPEARPFCGHMCC